jgi:hypothetical protein
MKNKVSWCCFIYIVETPVSIRFLFWIWPDILVDRNGFLINNAPLLLMVSFYFSFSLGYSWYFRSNNSPSVQAGSLELVNDELPSLTSTNRDTSMLCNGYRQLFYWRRLTRKQHVTKFIPIYTSDLCESACQIDCLFFVALIIFQSYRDATIVSEGQKN